MSAGSASPTKPLDNFAQTLSDHNVARQPAADPLETIKVSEQDIGGTRYLITFAAKGMAGGCTPPAGSWAEAGELLKRHPLYNNKAKGWFSLHYQVPWPIPEDTKVMVEDFFPVVEGARLIGEASKDYGPPLHPLTSEKLDWMAPLNYQAPGVLTYNKETTEWVWEKEGPPVIEVSPAPKRAFVCFEGAGRGVVAEPVKKKVKFNSPLTREVVEDKFGNEHVLEYTSKKQRAEQLETIEERAEQLEEQKSPPSITAFKIGTHVRTIDGTDRKGIVIGCALKAKDETYLGIAFDDEPKDDKGYRKTESYPITKLEVHRRVDMLPEGGAVELLAERFTPPPTIVRTASVDMKLDDDDDDELDEVSGGLGPTLG